jgi:hypothetical protein
MLVKFTLHPTVALPAPPLTRGRGYNFESEKQKIDRMSFTVLDQFKIDLVHTLEASFIFKCNRGKEKIGLSLE